MNEIEFPLDKNDDGKNERSQKKKLNDDYKSLPLKTYLFFKSVLSIYPTVKYIAKVDDDVLMNPMNMLLATHQYEKEGRDYISCMKHGTVFTNPRQKWNEPQHHLLGEQYFLHAWGPMYMLSGAIASVISSIPPEFLRAFANEDVSVGSWMLALNAKHFDDRRMCHTQCQPNSIAVFDYPKCSGMCDPVTGFADAFWNPQCFSIDDDIVPILSEIDGFPVGIGEEMYSSKSTNTYKDEQISQITKKGHVGVEVANEHSIAELFQDV